MVHQVKSHSSGWLPSGVEWGAMGLLGHLVTGEGRRQRELVCVTRLDPSTVSRHVAGLVQAGLVERRADPADGRAVRLVATDRGHELHARMTAHRVAALAPLIEDWDHDEVVRLTAMLTRLCDRMQVEHLDDHPTCPGHREHTVAPGTERATHPADPEESR
jgi:DNA-binding MarR family transcriptional regulator